MKKAFFILICMSLIFTASCSKTEGISSKDLEFNVNGEYFLLDTEVTSLLDELGEEFELQEAPSCVYEGKDKTFIYEGVEIYTYPIEDKDMIDEILVLDSSYKTERGISVGDTREEVVKAYGEEYTDEGGILKYSIEPGNMDSPCIYFQFDGDAVTSISYYSASNM